MQKYVPLLGWGGLFFGVLTAIFAWPSLSLLFFALFTMFPGFLLSSLYIMFSTRYEMETPRVNPGYLGLLLNSAPLIMFLIFILSA